jgi:hypothetical protein
VKLRMLSLSAALCLSIITMARPSMAQVQELKPEPPLVRQMLQEGWTRVADGVLQRTGEGGQAETFTYGEEGLRWTARKLEARLGFLQNEYNAHPSEDVARLIASLETQLGEIDQNLKNGTAQAEVPSPSEMTDCSINYGANASASHRTDSTQGTLASASANFSATCGQLGNTYAYAYARATVGTLTTVKIQEDPRYNGTALNSAAAATAPGGTDCYSEAYARAWSPTLSINYEVGPYTNYSCPQPLTPINAYIDGPSDAYFDDYYTPCSYITWTVYPSGGVPGYSYNWYINSVYQGSGSSLTKYYCRTNGYLNVRADVYDSASQSTSAYYTTWLSYQQSCSSSCGCYTEPRYPREICPYEYPYAY